MKIFYLCRTGHHTSLLAAALDLGLISPRDGSQACSLAGYNEFSYKDLGRPYYVGQDSKGREIYTFGTGKESMIMTRAANDIILLTGAEPGSWKIVDTSPFISGWTTLGLMSERLHLTPLAGLLFRLGAHEELARLSKKIFNTKYH